MLLILFPNFFRRFFMISFLCFHQCFALFSHTLIFFFKSSYQIDMTVLNAEVLLKQFHHLLLINLSQPSPSLRGLVTSDAVRAVVNVKTSKSIL